MSLFGKLRRIDPVESELTTRELTPRALVDFVGHQMRDDRQPGGADASSGFALMLIELGRSDRNLALQLKADAVAASAQVRERVMATLRSDDRFALIGHDELVVVLCGVTSAGVAALAAHRLLEAFAADIRVGATLIQTRARLGCALYPDHGHTVEELFAAAEDARHEAQGSQASFAVARPATAAPPVASLDRLRAALSNNALGVWFQPQVSLIDGTCTAAEALLRDASGSGIPMLPSEMAELAESNGLMTDLTAYVLNVALRQLTDLAQLGIAVRLAVNTSASLLRDPEFAPLVARALATWGVAARNLTLEVTESAIIADIERSLATLHDLKHLGVRLSIDDFGTGYSSLSYLRRMPLNELKIDRVFIHKMTHSRADAQIVRAVVDLAHNFGIEAVAEGVEDAATLVALREMGCDWVQGFYYGRPMDPAAFVRWWPNRLPPSAILANPPEDDRTVPRAPA